MQRYIDEQFDMSGAADKLYEGGLDEVNEETPGPG